MRANHKSTWVSVKTGRGETQVHLEPGQFIFGRFAVARDLGANPVTTYKRLLKLKKFKNVTTQNKVHYTLVAVKNWDLYQNTETALPPKVSPKYHPSITDKKDKNDKTKNIHGKFVHLTHGEYAKLTERFGKEDADRRIRDLDDGIGSKGYKYKSHYHTILVWANREAKQKAAESEASPIHEPQAPNEEQLSIIAAAGKDKP